MANSVHQHLEIMSKCTARFHWLNQSILCWWPPKKTHKTFIGGHVDYGTGFIIIPRNKTHNRLFYFLLLCVKFKFQGKSHDSLAQLVMCLRSLCQSCVYAKATRKSIPKTCDSKHAKNFGKEVHSDLWRPAPIETKRGWHYYITFIDDYTWLTHLYLLCTKDEAFVAYQQFEAWCGNQLKGPICVLHSDRGGEYLGKEFTAYLKLKGTEQKLTVHHTPQHNGVAEWCNCTIIKHIWALLHASGLPKYLWGEAACHVIWLMNRTSTKAVEGKTPYEAAFGVKPDLSAYMSGAKNIGSMLKKGISWVAMFVKAAGLVLMMKARVLASIEGIQRQWLLNTTFISILLVHQLIVLRGRIGSLSKWQLTNSPPNHHPLPPLL